MLKRSIATVFLALAAAVSLPAAAHAMSNYCNTCAMDGPTIVLTRDSGDAGGRDIYSMAADGSGMTRLTTSSGPDTEPSWAPNKSQIVFASNRNATGYTPEFELYVMAANGSRQQRLTTSPGQDWEPAWSPAGDKIAFTSTRDGQSEIYTMSPNGSNLQRLTNDAAFDNQPQWAPDGQHIVFASNRWSNFRNLYVMDADGRNTRRLTSFGGDEYNPSWSKDGSKIAFSRDVSGNQDIFWVPANAAPGSAASRVTTNANYDGKPTWSPDGRIAFGSQNVADTHDSNILVVNQDGTGLKSLTTAPVWEDEANWAPAQQPPPRSYS
jgi:Tol biopolymer transport system component